MQLAAMASGRLREFRPVASAESWARLALAASPFASEVRRVREALLACRRASSPAAQRALSRILAPYVGGSKTSFCREHKVGWARYYNDFDLRSPELTSSLVLKAPAPDGEKGVLYVAFEYNVMRLLAHSRIHELLRDYIIVGASSWSPTDFAMMASFAGLGEDPLFLCVSNAADEAAYRIAAPAVRPSPLLASNWIDSRLYQGRPHEEREIDFLMVANFSRFKRHWLLFRALRDMPRDVRVTILGMATADRTADVLRAEARAFGVRQDLDIRTNVSIEEVAACQGNARVSLIFSRREGSCVATAESLFAGAPVGMMRDAHIGSKAYINEATGVLLDYRNLPRQLLEFRDRSGTYRAREWADANISAWTSSARLNTEMRDYARETRRPWTRDLAPMCWRYVPSYLDAADAERLQPAVDELAQRYNVRLKKFVYRAPGS